MPTEEDWRRKSNERADKLIKEIQRQKYISSIISEGLIIKEVPIKREEEKEEELESIGDLKLLGKRIESHQEKLSKLESYIMIADTLIKFLSPAILTILISVIFLLPFQIKDIPTLWGIPITATIGICICIILIFTILAVLKWRIKLRKAEHNTSYYYERYKQKYLDLFNEKIEEDNIIMEMKEKLSGEEKAIITILKASDNKINFKQLDSELKKKFEINIPSHHQQILLNNLKDLRLIHVSPDGKIIKLTRLGRILDFRQ